MFYDQSGFDVRCEWGLRGAEILSETCDAIIIVDVLSFSTCVDVACSRDALVYPYRFNDEGAAALAQRVGATLAAKRSHSAVSLSPSSLLLLDSQQKIVLPSPNGSTLSLKSTKASVFAGCLRNAQAVARYVAQRARTIGVVPAGERWEDGTLRPAFEDALGAGAIISFLLQTKSPEALSCQHIFEKSVHRLGEVIGECSSGRELTERGYQNDSSMAGDFNQSSAVPMLYHDRDSDAFFYKNAQN